MVDVKVRGDQVIDLFHASHLGRRLVEASGISAARHAGVDEDRLAGGRDYQRAAASLDVDPVNIKRLRVLREGSPGDQQRGGRCNGFDEGFNLESADGE